MEITINHTTKTFDVLPENLEALMAMEIPGKKKGIAVALNNRIIPLSAWAETLLKNKDSVLIITATQGG
ncbi:sulfur carrier protein ThiS [Chryseobacterium carnipullorum]|uniref:Sulfur carrier protein ThiS n=1 Tax=Chryseobacterium carnipullorum TaxID=1124835 RepID=A0A1M7AE83_CHRCU|nr:sulfur carrier protein ThiS [Chryseobacterium carnipullorum]MDN5395249.1 sulfur carrier protein ThiS [Chryseobacterium sp.]AZA48128.1 sulfur carrier protein ThiS [Chryseobacterium carnipullorum]AZA67440.1 sulfur carrier protein ThiS [Chryseobacterium carnipullorum]MDN5421854.1 sulfur carrier protein ThiS [Chryseobacterium sp.]MDN5475467.1 sulfur carrier protein ThiS [Chryseobacterium sp.]